ncbi:4-aminobutyrate--2-oxoglutarate transaminase [Rhodococcus sp. CX]|uniref:4-aminobutyrate--2-oxoglutarate transaminase n=1 Tax=Rhodococcus sp. CX TaxID=2789880 RepID=UPI0018CEB055|nr:4-aminobutyrate--2-oxoglutarate transaminase [Rhodococcus sp. CX]MBH0120147.1 4-aminobutyrate--2-oxoglutarate transaminase [Rhodococcus sp. CX]
MNLAYRLPQRRSLRTLLPGPRSTELTERRRQAVGAGVGSSVPVYVADADGGVIVDVDGNSLIDLGAGIAVTSVGASDPAVVEAVREQAGRFTHTCFMVTPYEGYIEVAERLAELTLGDHPKRTVLFNSGAEAVENAVKIARIATGRDAVVVFDHAYHGRTNLTMAMTAKNMPYKHGFGPFAPEVYRVPMSYPFREGLGYDGTPVTGEQAARRAVTLIEKQVGAENVAAIVIEPIQGEGGFIVPAPGFLPALADWARDHGVVFVADEVQTGFARTGSWFACEHEQVVPDLMTLAKGIAGGLPLAAVTGRADLLDAVHPGGLGGTYGGNPIACAAALATLARMRDLDLPARARHIADIAVPRLQALADECDIVGEVRGRGAMLAIEFVMPGSREPNPVATAAVAAAALAQGVVLLTCGTYSNVIRLLPPLVIPDELLVEALDVLEDAVRAV